MTVLKVGLAFFILGCTSVTLCSANQAAQKKACTSEQIKSAEKAMTEARAGISKAISSFKSPSPADLIRQARWFGALASNSAKEVLSVYERSLVQAVVTIYWCPTSNDLTFKWDVGDAAAVHPNEAGAMFFTPKYFDLGITGADSQMGTIVHELTHLVGVGWRPEVYGTTKAKELAIKSPARARGNSDNFQYYVEDLVFKLP